MNFAVNSSVIVCNLLDLEIRARMAGRKNPERMAEYREKGVIDSSQAITDFMQKYPNVFASKKLVSPNGNNFFSEILSLSSLSDTESYRDRLKNRMEYEYDLSDEELKEMEPFLDDLANLNSDPEVQEIVQKTVKYKDSIERIWRENESKILGYVKKNLSYEPEGIGKVSTYIMFPNIDTHRSCQLTNDKTFLFFGKRERTNKSKEKYKTLAYLTHQAVHQPMLPYKSFMTKEQKEKFHAFIKFLTDKDVYSYLSGESYLDIITENEKPVVMGAVYPYWLGYRYRNAEKEGLNPEKEIKKAIDRDKKYYDSLPVNSKKRKLYSSYNFEKLDPSKIAMYFRERRGMTPYDFAQIDFDNKVPVYNDAYLPTEVAR